MFYRFFWVLPFACSVHGAVVRLHPDGSTPSGKTDPSTIKDCTYWANVQPGDTCSSIASFSGITPKDLIRFNPSLKGDCSGLRQGYSYCVEENFAIATSVSSIAKSSPTSTAHSPVQPGIISTCRDFYKVVSGDTCQRIVDRYSKFTLSNFYAWNPSVGADCRSLFLGYYVCVGISSAPAARPPASAASGPSPTQTGIRSDCKRYYQAISGDTCDAIAGKFQTFSTAEFESWNPAVGSRCSSLLAGYYYCVAILGTPTTQFSPPSRVDKPPVVKGPQPQQPGTAANCNKYYQVVAGDVCYLIEERLKISADDFNLWNPGVGPDCKSLFRGYFICVGV